MKPAKNPNNRQQRYGNPADWYLHPRKGWKRKRPHERRQNQIAEFRLKHIFRMGQKDAA